MTSDFKGVDKFLNQFCKKLESTSVTKSHVFTAEASNSTILQVRPDDTEGAPSAECQQLLKKPKGQGIRIKLLASAEKNMEILASPGVPDIKKVENPEKDCTKVKKIEQKTLKDDFSKVHGCQKKESN